MKKSVKIRVISLIISAVVLCGAITVTAITGSPYETLKNALFNAITYKNATVEGSMTLAVNGIVMQEDKAYYIIGDNSTMNWYFYQDGNFSGYTYSSNALSVSPSYTGNDGTQWYQAGIRPQNDYDYYRYSSIGMMTLEDRNSTEIRFLELLADTLIGDLKSNITMSTSNGIRTIRGTLTGSQVPELFKAGLDLIAEQSTGYYYNTRDVSLNDEEYTYEQIRITRGNKTTMTWKQPIRPLTEEEKEALTDGSIYSMNQSIMYGLSHVGDTVFMNTGNGELISEHTVPASRSDYRDTDTLRMPMKSIAVNYLKGEAEVDRSGNLISLVGSAFISCVDIFDGKHDIEVQFQVSFSDIGTSDPACPIPGAEQILTSDYAKKHFGNEYLRVYFTLNNDGSIDTDSITTTYPGQLDRPLSSYHD